ncbi:MAG TPA: protein kinase [Candidatus Koribacter sp.]|jgi:serine/threonine protein kinase
MGLTPGTKLGPYEIVAPLGAGGMGEVYRARDSRLDRTVAIKVLNSSLVANDELRARFDREARIISQLQHPHICVLHDVGREGSLDFLVMEFLEGESLAERLKKGPLTDKELLKISIEVADALEKAHRAGVVHRDLKPGNVMLTKTGAKLLDFGLAKPITGGGSASSMSASVSVFAAAMTQTSPSPSPVSPLSSAGTVIGTVQYMSPEQIQGMEADARSDIFAFGVMLFEMATGKHAFDGKTRASIVGQILAVDPPSIETLRPDAPGGLARVIQICLHKEADERFQTAHDLKLELQRIATEPAAKEEPAEITAPSKFGFVPWAMAGLLLVAAVWLGYKYIQAVNAPQMSIQASILPPEKAQFSTNGSESGGAALSPDGKRLAFVARESNAASDMLWIQPLNSRVAQAMSGTEGATYPFWSPDSRFVGFFAGGKLKKMDANGGPPQALCDAIAGRGAAWSRDDVILFSPTSASPLFRVPAAGGTPVQETRIDSKAGSTTHRWPIFLPDGKHFIFWTTDSKEADNGGLYLSSLGSKNRKLLVQTESSGDYADGHLLFLRDGVLMEQKLNLSKQELEGSAAPVAEQVAINTSVYRSQFTVSNNGMLAYVGGSFTSGSQLVWYGREGKAAGPIFPEAALYSSPVLSPDGKRLAYALRVGSVQDIWVLDLERQTKSRLTFGTGRSFFPLWSPDGKWIYYVSIREGMDRIFRRPADGTGNEEKVLWVDGSDLIGNSISSDGKYMLYMRHDLSANNDWDIYALPLSGEPTPIPQVTTQFREVIPVFSPDGHWIAYQSNESGVMQIYMKSFPGESGKYQVSTGGGQAPRWRGDGKELFFQGSEGIYAVDVRENGAALQLGTPHLLFKANLVGPATGPFSPSADGMKFVINQAGSSGSNAPLTLLTNWEANLKQ